MEASSNLKVVIHLPRYNLEVGEIVFWLSFPLPAVRVAKVAEEHCQITEGRGRVSGLEDWQQ